MDEFVYVYVELNGSLHLCGRLWARARKGQESATFEYDASWLKSGARFSLDPALVLGTGAFQTGQGKALFGAIGDSAPDRWGRVLMRRAERRAADREGRAPRTLREIDYLLLVDDEARLGALRFSKEADGPFLRADSESRIPPVVKLPRLLAAAEHFENEKDDEEDLRLLLVLVLHSEGHGRRLRSVDRTAICSLQNSRTKRMKPRSFSGKDWRCGSPARLELLRAPRGLRRYLENRCYCSNGSIAFTRRESRSSPR